MKGLKFVLFSAVLAILICSRVYSKNAQRDISNGVIRFHVLANSDSTDDQQLKIKVRDDVLSGFENGLSKMNSRKETVKYLEKNVEAIRDCAQNTVYKNGYDYPVKVTVQNDYFPTKKYGDVTLPAGDYTALRIEIGEANGHNWWCVLFPPLCYVDVTQAEIPDKEKDMLKQNMNEEDYALITDDNTPVRVKFKIVEFWNSIK
jgi:stage II sporulation protein R